MTPEKSQGITKVVKIHEGQNGSLFFLYRDPLNLKAFSPKIKIISLLVTISAHLPFHARQHEVMSSECWVEPCGEGQAGKIGLEKQQEEEAEKEEVEDPCGDNRPAGTQRQEEEPGERPSSPDHNGMQEVTSKSGLGQIQREETQTQEKRESFSHISVNQETQHRGSGVWKEKRNLKRDIICSSFHIDPLLEQNKIQSPFRCSVFSFRLKRAPSSADNLLMDPLKFMKTIYMHTIKGLMCL